jgi:hypothetical protein
MDVKRSELLKALKQCLPGIESGNAVLEGADLFVFQSGFVHSYNDLISVSVPVKSEGLLDDEIQGAVRAEEFYGIINKFSGEMISFDPLDDKWVLKSGKARAELTLMTGDFSKRFETIAPEKKKWKALPIEFTQGLGISRMTNNRNAISGIYITNQDIMSSDGYQINRYSYEGPDIDPFWISDASAGELLKVGALESIQIKTTWVHFRTSDGVVFSLKTLQAEKWPYEKLVSVLDAHAKSKKDIAATFPKDLFDAIDRAASFYLDISDSKVVRLVISPKNIKVSAERAAGKFQEIVDWKEEHSEFDFEPFELYVDTGMMLFAARRSMAFYIHEGGGKAPRLIFTTDHSIHLMSTLSKDEITSGGKEPKEEKKPAGKSKPKPEPEEEGSAPKKDKGKSKAKTPPSDEEDDEEDDVPVWHDKKGRPSVNPPDEDEDEDDDEPPSPKKGKAKHREPEEEDDIPPKKNHAHKPKPKPKPAPEPEYDDEEEEDDLPRNRKPSRREEIEEDDDDDLDLDEDEE